MEVRALVAVQGPSQEQSQVQQNVHKIPNHPVICSIACQCFENSQRQKVHSQDDNIQVFPNQNQLNLKPNQRQTVFQTCCGALDCVCRRNLSLLPYQMVEKGTETPQLESERTVLNPNMFYNGFLRAPVAAETEVKQELRIMNNKKMSYELEDSYYSNFENVGSRRESNDTRNHFLGGAFIEPRQSNPINQMEDFMKLNGRANQSQLTIKTDTTKIHPVMTLRMGTGNSDLMVGGVSIQNKYQRKLQAPQHHSKPQTANPQFELIRTVCSTKNSFLPNFKLKKREYSFGEHRRQNQSILATHDNDYFGGGQIIQQESYFQRAFSPPVGSGRNSSPLKSKSPKKNEVEKLEISQMQRLEKLVKHRHKLSHLIKDSIQRDATRKIAQPQQNSFISDLQGPKQQPIQDGVIFSVTKESIPIHLPGSAQSSIRPLYTLGNISCNDTFQQQVEEILSPLSGAGDYSEFPSQPPSPIKPQTAEPQQEGQHSRQRALSQNLQDASRAAGASLNTQTRSVIIINSNQGQGGTVTSGKAMAQIAAEIQGQQQQQHQQKRARKILADQQQEKINSLELGRNAGHIIEEILARNGTDDDTNYLKFVVNEMKPNYRDQKVLVINEQQANAQPLTSLNPRFVDLAGFLGQSPIQFGSGNLQQDQVSQSDEDPIDILDFAKLQYIKSDNETLEGDIDALNKEGDFTPQPTDSNPIKKYGRAQSQATGKRANMMRAGAKGSFRNEYLKIKDQSPKSASKNVRKGETQRSLLDNSVAQGANKSISAHEDKAKSILSDSQSNTKKQGGGGPIFSDRGAPQSSLLDDSASHYHQLKQIKFKLMIMKSPDHVNLPPVAGGPVQDKKKRAKTRSKQESRTKRGADFLSQLQDKEKPINGMLAMLDDQEKRDVKKKLTMIDLTYVDPGKKGGTGRNSTMLSANKDGGQKSSTKVKLGATTCQEKEEKQQEPLADDATEQGQIIQGESPGGVEVELKISNMASAQEKDSQQTIYASSGAPLNSKLNAVYKKGQGKIKNIQVAKEDRPNSAVIIEPSVSPDEDLEQNFEEFLVKNTQSRRRQLQGSNFDFKSGGEIGNGFFSSHVLSEQPIEDTDSENKKAVLKLRKSAYQVLSQPQATFFNRKSESRKPSQLNQDIHAMIIQGDMKERHQRLLLDRNLKASPKEDMRDSGSHIKTIIPTVENFMKDDHLGEKHDTLLSIESSNSTNRSADRPKPHVLLVDDAKDKLIDLEKSNDAMIQFQDLYLKNNNYLMRYGDTQQQQQSKANSHKDDGGVAANTTNGDYVDEKDLGIQAQSGVFLQQLSNQGGDMLSYVDDKAQKKSKKSPKIKNGRTRIEQIQKMNQSLRPKTGDIGSGVLQGRPIKPIRVLIRENLIALSKMQSTLGYQKVPHQIFIDLLGSPRLEVTPENSKQVADEEEDINLSKYLWTTLHQLKREGYPIDLSVFTPYHSRQNTPAHSRQGVTQMNQGNSPAPQHEDPQAFNNKRIKHAHSRLMAHLSGSSDRQKNSARMNFDKVKKSTMAVNADLMQYTYIEDQLEKPGQGLRYQSHNGSGQWEPLDQNKKTEVSILRTEEDRNIIGDTMNSQPGTHRNSYFNPVQPKYGLDAPINIGQSDERYHTTKTDDIRRLEQALSDQLSSSNNHDDLQGRKKLQSFGKTLPFDLHLMRMNSPNLPAPLLSPRTFKELDKHVPSTTKNIDQPSDINTITLEEPKLRRNVVIARKTESAQGDDRLITNNKFVEKRRSEHHPDPRRPNFSQPPKSEFNLESNNNNETISRRPSNISKIPNAIEGVYIKTYDAVQSSYESQTLSEAMKNSIFFANHPAFIQDQIKAQSIMSLRNKRRRILANTHIQTTNKPNDAIKEYTGGEIKIKELQAMRKPDPTLTSPNIDYQDYFKPIKSGWGHIAHQKRASSHARDQRFNQTRPDLSQSAVQRPFTGFMSPINQTTVVTPSSRFSGATSPIPQPFRGGDYGFQSPLIQPSHLMSPNSVQRATTSLSSSRQRPMKPHKMNQAIKVKKGRALEGTTSGVKPSDGYKII